MIDGSLFAFVIFIAILAVGGKCLEMKHYHHKFRLLREEMSLLGNTNYISFNSDENSGDSI